MGFLTNQSVHRVQSIISYRLLLLFYYYYYFFNTPKTYTWSNENKNYIAIIFKNNANPLESDPIKPKWLIVSRGESGPVPTEARKTGRTFNLISHPKTD